jgi:hypothetical protein
MGACAGKNSPQSSTLAAAGKQKKTVLSDHLKMGEQSLKPAFSYKIVMEQKLDQSSND